MTKKTETLAGRGNIFAELGLPNSEVALVKVQLIDEIKGVIARRRWIEAKAAAVLGIDQEKLSALARMEYGMFSIERLIKFINALGINVWIVTRPAQPGKRGKMSVRPDDRPLDTARAERRYREVARLALYRAKHGRGGILADDAFAAFYRDNGGKGAVLMRTWRRIRKMTQREVAQRLRVSVRRISRMENGKLPITEKMTVRLAKIFKMDAALLEPDNPGA